MTFAQLGTQMHIINNHTGARFMYIRQFFITLLVAAAIALEVYGGSSSSNILEGLLLLSGGQVFMSGLNISKQADMHSAAIQELSESFGADMEPIILDIQGQTHELSGTAQEQYRQWRGLLKEIYLRETGIVPPDVVPTEPAGS